MAGGADPEAHIQFLEAAYDWELNQDDAWLRRVVEAAVRIWGRPVWACGFEYDASDVSRFSVVGPPVFVDAHPLVPRDPGPGVRQHAARRGRPYLPEGDGGLRQGHRGTESRA